MAADRDSANYHERIYGTGHVEGRKHGAFATGGIRTALVGDGASGKTTLAEALLAKGRRATGRRQHRARHDGQRFRSSRRDLSSIRSALRFCTFEVGRNAHSPDRHAGLPDFIGQAIGALDAVETAAVVVERRRRHPDDHVADDGMGGETRLCRLIVINKIDAENVDLPGALARDPAGRSARSACRSTCRRTAAKRVVDCFFNPSGESDFSSVGRCAPARSSTRSVEVDEALMATATSSRARSRRTELHAPFEKALREGHLVPVCFVSARTGAGVAELLDILVKLAPNPAGRQSAAVLQGRRRRTPIEFRIGA